MLSDFNRELQYAVFALEPRWDLQAAALERELRGDGVRCEAAQNVACGRKSGKSVQTKSSPERCADGRAKDAMDRHIGSRENTVILTDDRRYAASMARDGWTVVGCTEDAAFFDGAVLVTDAPETLDARCLEECLLRAQGRPVTIARTERLILREIAPEDFDALYRISRQPGMEYALSEPFSRCFERDCLTSYIKYAYRFYGCGLWSVKLPDGKLIGCCGFHEWMPAQDPEPQSSGQPFPRKSSPEQEFLQPLSSGQPSYYVLSFGRPRQQPADQPSYRAPRLELQYMLDRKFQRQGYGLEMCRAALRYVFVRTDWNEVWVRIHPRNDASLRLAGKLGFQEWTGGASASRGNER